MDSLLKSSRVIVCAGSGGVGKTTLSAALGYQAARLGLRVLVLTVDPAQRLATALGLSGLDEEVRVSAPQLTGEFYAAQIHPENTFRNFVRENAPSADVAERLLQNPLFQRLTTTLSGSQEFTSLERLYSCVNSRRYDLVILDTPPTAHAIDILDGTRRLEEFMQDSVLKWFLAPFESRGFLGNLVHRGTRLVMGAFESVVGRELVDELVAFFTAISHFREPLLKRFKEVRALFADSKTSFILVTAFDEQKILESRFFRDELVRRQLNLKAVIVNRAFPEWVRNRSELELPGIEESLAQRYRKYFDDLERFYLSHQKELDRFQNELGRDVQVYRLVDFDQEVVDMDSLGRVATELVREGT